MTLPLRTSDPSPEGGAKTNVIELSTIKGAPRRKPYVFQVEPPAVASRPNPYVFPEDLPDAESEEAPKVRFFDFLSRGKAVYETPAPSLPDPWGSLTESLQQAADPEAVAAMLAELLAKLDELAERRRQRLQRVVPRGAIAIPPLCIATTLLSANYLAGAMAMSLGVPEWGALAPWFAGLLAVPLGLCMSSLFLGAVLRNVRPGDTFRFGSSEGRIQAKGRLAWHVEFDGEAPRRLPYYLVAYAAVTRIPESGEPESASNGL